MGKLKNQLINFQQEHGFDYYNYPSSYDESNLLSDEPEALWDDALKETDLFQQQNTNIQNKK